MWFILIYFSSDISLLYCLTLFPPFNLYEIDKHKTLLKEFFISLTILFSMTGVNI